MIFLKLSVLTFIISAPGLTVSEENMITCYGDVQRLNCETGLITVKSSLYGRTDPVTCSTNRPSSQVTNTNCNLRITTIANSCNGLKECELKTDLLGDPDPCFGTYKYYNTTYDCIDGRSVVICEDGYSTLHCGDDSIQIINANYGRANSRTCSNGIPDAQTKNTNCYAPSSFSTVTSQCNGKKRCTVRASNTIFTDPCFGTSKYLTVSYICTRNIVTCEHDTAALTCGSRYLKIISSNYGRTDPTTCSSGRPPSQLTNTKCYSSDTLSKVAARCEGKSSCQVPATNDFFSDPCVGTFKYLNIVYACV
ncbi:rhamnose-binding lectin-like [Clarias gariepinus]